MEKKLESNREIYDAEQRKYEEVLNLVEKYKATYPDIDFVVGLESNRDINLEVEKHNTTLIKKFTSYAYVMFVQDGVILERKKGAGEWPGSSAQLVHVSGWFSPSIEVNDDFELEFSDNLTYEIKEYQKYRNDYYKNRKDSEDILSTMKQIKWFI